MGCQKPVCLKAVSSFSTTRFSNGSRSSMVFSESLLKISGSKTKYPPLIQVSPSGFSENFSTVTEMRY